MMQMITLIVTTNSENVLTMEVKATLVSLGNSSRSVSAIASCDHATLQSWSFSEDAAQPNTDFPSLAQGGTIMVPQIAAL